jgi:hypothetical protein
LCILACVEDQHAFQVGLVARRVSGLVALVASLDGHVSPSEVRYHAWPGGENPNEVTLKRRFLEPSKWTESAL